MALSTKTAVKPDDIILRDLVNWVEKGTLLIPDFQRPFVWNETNMLELFDSILKGYPIGTFLLWEPGNEVARKIQTSKKIGPLRIKPTKGETVTFVLDGFQRLSTLYGILYPHKDKLKNNLDNWKWNLYYDLEDEELKYLKGSHPAIPPAAFPLHVFTDTLRYVSAIRSLSGKFSSETEAELIQRADIIASGLTNYRIGYTLIQGGDEDSAVEIFTRLNSRGRKVSQVHMLNALTKNKLSEHIDRIRESLAGYHFGGIDEIYILRSIFAASGGDNIYLKKPENFVKRHRGNLDSITQKAEESLCRAAEFLLDDLRVPGLAFLPYSLQLVFLAEFFRLQTQPTPAQKDYLNRWFWSTSASGWFGSLYSNKANKGLAEMRAFAQGHIQQFTEMNLDDPAGPLPDPFRMNSARARLFVLFLMELNPINLKTGQPESIFNLMLLHEYDLITNLQIPGSSTTIATRFLSGPQSGRTLLNHLSTPGLSNAQQILTSHGLTPQLMHYLQNGDYDVFFQGRLDHITALEADFLRKKGVVV